MKFLSLTFSYKRETRTTTRRKLLIVFLTKFNFVNLINRNVKLFLYLSIYNLTFIFWNRDIWKIVINIFLSIENFLKISPLGVIKKSKQIIPINVDSTSIVRNWSSMVND